MTRDELIKYLNDTFGADEEINFVYNDYGDYVRTTKCIIKTHYLNKMNDYYEWLEYVKDENGNLIKKWIKLTNEQVKDINCRRRWKDTKYLSTNEINNRLRWVTVNNVNDNKTCLFIG